MKTSGNKKLGTCFDLVLFFYVVIVLAYIILTNTKWKEPNLLSSLECTQFSNGWERVYPNGTKTVIELNCDYYLEGGETLVLERKLPMNVEDNMYIGFRSKRQYSKVYIDGKLRFDFSIEGGYKDVGKIVSRYIFVRLTREDRNKTIRIEGYSPKSGDRRLTDIYIGDKAGIITNYLVTMRGSVIMCAVFLIVGVLSVVFGIAIRFITRNEVRTDYMGWAMFLIAVWDLSQSDFRDFFFTNISMISLLPILTLSLIPLPLALYFNRIQDERYHRIYYAYAAVTSVNAVVWGFLGGSHVVAYSNALTSAFILVFSLAALFLVLSFIDGKKGFEVHKYSEIVTGVCAMCLGGLGQMYTYFTPRESEQGAYLSLGSFFLTSMAFLHAMKLLFNLSSDKKAAEIAAETKTQFLATMSHEIRTPINAVLGLNEAIRRESSEENIIKYADDVNSAGNLLLALVNDILDFSKLESGKMNLVKTDFDLKEYTAFVYGMVESKARDKGLTFNLYVNDQMPSVLNGDEVRLQQIVINLLNNAVKYTEKGMVGLLIDFYSLEDDRIMFRVSVKDTGCGIKDEDKGKLFEAFTRVDEARNRKIEGTGLGLAISSKFVELMHGRMSVESVYGSGSTFTIEIPLKVSDTTPVGPVTVNSLSSIKIHTKLEEFTAPGFKLLVVDDVALNLKVVQALLKKSEIEIDVASSGDKGLEFTRKKKYDLILLDHMMPDKDGVETLNELKAEKKNPNLTTPVVMMTANAMNGAKGEYLALGFDDYISKPIKIQDLRRVILK